MEGKITARKIAYAAVIVAMLAILFYSFLLQVHELAIKPSDIAQAGGARFYENFVYNSSDKIPNSCLVFSYDPTLFNIVGRSSVQYYYLYNQSFIGKVSAEYKCLVIDYGYWCGTPGNICKQAFSEYKTSPIATATYSQTNFKYGFYRIIGYNSS